MIRTAAEERPLATGTRLNALRLMVFGGILAIGTAAAAAPDNAGPAPARAAVGKPAAAEAATIKLAAAKKDKKAKARSNPKSKPGAKAARAPASKSAPKSASKPAANAAASAAPLPVARPSTGAPAAVAATAAAVEGKPLALPPPARTIITAAAIDVSAVKRAVELVRRGKQSDAGDIRKGISDPAARKLVEWVILRSDDSGADFERYAAFITANPNWPSIVTLRRKAEAAAFQDRVDNEKVRAFLTQWPPLSAKGRFAFARALLSAGDRKGAEAQVREAWRYDSFSPDVEKRVFDTFGELLTPADHKARMDRRLYEKDDVEAGLRAAQRLGGHEPAIAKARAATLKSGNHKAALDAVPAAARNDIGYKFARIQTLRRSKHLAEAVALIRTIPVPLDPSHDLDEWWVERRVLARELIDGGDARNAYLVARDATPPVRDNYRSEHQFTAGWIALRFLNDAATAYAHFSRIAEGNDNPITLARRAYWMGRAAETLKLPQQARAHYREAARYPTAYYGQIAHAKAGLGELVLTPFPSLSSEQRAKATQGDVVRAAELLYAVDARDIVWAMMADLGDKSGDIGVLTVLAELTAKYKDARGMLLLGKLALARGYALDHAAFPTIGVPDYKPLGPPVEPSIVYSIVRQESWFNPKTISTAKALGLMQVTPPTGRHIAKKFKIAFDQKRLLNDMAYNVQMGSAEIGDVIQDYRGSFIMAFAAYNAGRGRVKEWVGRFGDPRDPKVDPIDWVERIPFSETRNYVQRLMENLQVYRIRFGGSPRLLIEADLRRGKIAN
jgi:soluble lytic murein transglycosylase